jgi:putative transposase
MPIHPRNFAPFASGEYYHIFNHANGNDNLFVCDEDYNRFLSLLNHLITPHMQVLAWCLMPNHFHLVARVREADAPHLLIAEIFRLMFSTYAAQFNAEYRRRGSVFRKRFKHLWVDSPAYLYQVVHYVHRNPVHHGFVADLAAWHWSSFRSVRDATPDGVADIAACLDVFDGSRQQFLRLHGLEVVYGEEIKGMLVDV